MIDREKLIKALEQHCDNYADCKSCPYEPEETSIKCRDSLLCDCLEALKQPQWISVKDRLPRLRQWVLCKCRAGIYEVLRYEETCDGIQWHHDGSHNYMSGFVTHWMPLLEPPEGVMQDD